MSGLVFIGSLLGTMAIGVPIAFALMLSGVKVPQLATRSDCLTPGLTGNSLLMMPEMLL